MMVGKCDTMHQACWGSDNCSGGHPLWDRLGSMLQVATLGKSGVSVGYYETESNAARAYDRAAIGLLGRDNCSITTNFPLKEYDQEVVPQLIGKTREEVKTTLKNERAKVGPASHPLACGCCCSTPGRVPLSWTAFVSTAQPACELLG